MTSDICFILNVFNVIIISVANFACILLYICNGMGIQAYQPQPCITIIIIRERSSVGM